MSEYMHKARNASQLIYHIVCPAKYRRVAISDEADKTLRETCEGMEKRREIKFLEIGAEGGRMRFLARSAPTYSPAKIARAIKSVTAKEMFKKHPEVKEKLWGGEIWE
jgi:REP element-mobilizing transposase RayT